jgi:hypothetical protein
VCAHTPELRHEVEHAHPRLSLADSFARVLSRAASSDGGSFRAREAAEAEADGASLLCLMRWRQLLLALSRSMRWKWAAAANESDRQERASGGASSSLSASFLTEECPTRPVSAGQEFMDVHLLCESAHGCAKSAQVEYGGEFVRNTGEESTAVWCKAEKYCVACCDLPFVPTTT